MNSKPILSWSTSKVNMDKIIFNVKVSIFRWLFSACVVSVYSN